MWVTGQHDGLRAVRLRGELRCQTDAARADHQDRFAGRELGFLEAVHGAGERLCDRRQLAVDPLRRREDGLLGRDHLLRHAAVDGDADQAARDLALVVTPGGAVLASAAAQQRLDAHDVALA